MKKLIAFVFVILFVVSCGSGGKSERRKLREYFVIGNWKKAHEVIDKSDVYRHKDSRMLYWMEKGLLYHIEGEYTQSMTYLEKAKELSRELYKVRISGQVKSLIMNDNYDIYYGETYERSLIHLYLAMNHYLLAKRGNTRAVLSKKGKVVTAAKQLSNNEIRKEYGRARSEMIDWNSTLETFQIEKMGESVFKNDLLAKVFGGHIHEMVGSRTDMQIAYQLYKDAKKLLLRHYSSYKTFNSKSKIFKKEFKKVEGLGDGEIKKDYLVETKYSKSLSSYLNYKILSLSKRIRPDEFSRMVKIHSPSKTTLGRVNKNKSGANVGIILQKSMIPAKVPEKYYYGLDPSRMKSGAGKVVATIGHAVLTAFAVNKLGLGWRKGGWSPASAAIGVNVMALGVKHGVAINFQLPRIANKPTSDESWIRVKNSAGKQVRMEKLAILNPMGDIAEEAVAEKAAWRYGRTGARLAVKFAAAIATAYGAYAVVKSKAGDGMMARLAGVMAFAGAVKTIEASEKADTRYWGLLPKDFRVSDFFLSKGEYNLELVIKRTGKKGNRVIKIGPLVIKNEKKRHLVNFRTRS